MQWCWGRGTDAAVMGNNVIDVMNQHDVLRDVQVIQIFSDKIIAKGKSATIALRQNWKSILLSISHKYKLF